ncbi:AMP-dependent synthetase/ligase [Patulibacter minatonensis]|uniref:AMP-dependent synthetase/ligase n=1 Tax=Patulibacter minatonensis TaxID=298163 RepID=UPI0004B6ABC1|nr:AMP-binding protein [Patulibacter minatonensis]
MAQDQTTTGRTPVDPATTTVARGDDEARAAIAAAIAQPTVCAAFQVTWRASGDRPAYREHDGGTLTWADVGARVGSAAGGLDAIGLGRGDALAILARNVPLFNVVDLAALHVGAVPYSLYATEPLDQMIALVDDAGAPVIACERRFLDRAVAIADALPAVRRIVVLDEDAAPEDGSGDAVAPAGRGAVDDPRVLSLDALERGARPDFDLDAAWRAVGPDDLATLVYTSGTTGRPKGVQLPHRAIMSSLSGVEAMAPASPGGRGVSFLPAAHIVDRFVCHYTTIGTGATLTCVPDPDTLWDAIAETRPTRFFGVPRTWEKLQDRARATLAELPELESPLAERLARVETAGGSIDPAPGHGGAPDPARVALEPVRAALGLDRAEWLGVAAAPSSVDMLAFHHALGLEILEIWGMSEFMMATMNPPGGARLGSVGIALPDVETRLADDGEFLLRGPHACAGYRGAPEKTAELQQEGGWTASGDVATKDDDGYLRIVGRKKEAMINSSGKNLFPAKIESAVAEASPVIGWVASFGDRRRYVAALIVLDADELRAFASAHALEGDHAALSAHPVVRAEVQRAVDVGNARLSRVEHVRAHAVLPDVWGPGDGLVTNTMKLRRSAIAERHADEIEALYAG